MCFSAPASFTVAAGLMPVAAYTLVTALRYDRRYLGLGVFPLFFGLQQALEGGLWHQLAQDSPVYAHAYALGFLFFAYLVWPFLVPFAAFLVEPRKQRRTIFLGVSTLGGFLGLSLFMPLLFHPDWVPLRIVHHSIDYNTRLIWEGIVPYTVIRGVYACIVCAPLLLSSVKHVRMFGAIITLSVIIGFVFANYAFTSIWCFMAAIVSSALFFVLQTRRPSSTHL